MKFNNVLALSLFISNIATADLSAVVAAEEAGKKAIEQAKEKAKREAKEKEERAYKEYIADKRRDQAYEDLLRLLQLEAMKLELERKKARVKREDDFIEQELKREAAKTDVIQSDADARRNISKGTETLLIKEGEARVKKESGFFK
ncbi:hypothetical protein CEP48_07570 [Mergibacter septicus]|uniref:Uncharacterized protein n=1 Tax=Mergibacter septicus TaxID=221402 RepID=A0A8D4IYJ2_9PAST|nr:DUF5384 family protein [Mergibacter septicus]AWX16036.1 hypothetical protein CEP47_07570 [Mergibacter septicus]QDJ15289.1 hypothetical protein CEP48_07570 [Mergibacter septicus]UTU47294.1 DUF5384 family protein [Mergibacter septicus]WMR95528.1 DUF5384 family protein [Mergibacter septicus]